MGLLIEDCKIHGKGRASVFVEDGLISRISDGVNQSVPSGTTRVDGRGGTLLVGLTDTHCHPFEYGRSKRTLDLRGTSNIVSIRARLAARVQRTSPGEWIVGRGWDQEAFVDKRMPDRGDIDDISPGNPVLLTRVCGHIALLNTVAMRTLGIEGKEGPYRDDDTQEPSGIVSERALDEVYAAIPRGSLETSRSDLESFEYDSAKQGLTTVHCIVSSDRYAEELGALALRAADPSAGPCYRVYIPPEALGFMKERGLTLAAHGGPVRVNGVKIYADGSLGARTAALREPYADDPGNSGVLRYTDEDLSALVSKCHSSGYQVIIHAIGDRAIEQALASFDPVAGAGNPLRHRIEHASLVPPDLRSKMKRLGIRAAVQPCFITSDSWASKRLGEDRARHLYPLRSFLEEGILASGSSDSPVETLSPLLGIWSGMVRGDVAPEERLSLDQALSLYTTNAGSNGFDDGAALAEGRHASLTLLDSDIEGMHPAMIRKVGVAATIVSGELVYSFDGSGQSS